MSSFDFSDSIDCVVYIDSPCIELFVLSAHYGVDFADLFWYISSTAY